MKTSTRFAITALAVAGVLVAACTAGAAGTTAPTSSSTAPRTAPGITLVTGVDSCHEGASPAPSGYTMTADCERTSSDPRLSGTGDGGATFLTDGPIARMWGSGTIENAEGTWYCKWVGMGSLDLGVGWTDEVCGGQGAYAGLRAYLHAITPDYSTTGHFFGWIEEAE